MSLRGVAATALVLGALVLPSGEGIAAQATAPSNTAEPTISGRAEQGATLSTTNGTWTGTQPISFAYQWVRCGADGGQPDGGNCAIISRATDRRYRLVRADVGFRLRARVTAANADGARTVASNPTTVVVGVPVNTSTPTVTGTMTNGSTVTANPGAWTGKQPISFAFNWLRCNSAGGDCVPIGANGSTYRLSSADVGHKIRFDLTARNSLGSTTVRSAESPVVNEPLPSGAMKLPSGEISIPAASVPTTARLVVSQVSFSPSPARSRRNPITIRVRIKDTRGYVVRDALVFVRSTPRVTSGGNRQATTVDGWVTYPLVPNGNFPKPRKGFHVQFFVKAYRLGDPALAGVAAYRLVQVPLAGS